MARRTFKGRRDFEAFDVDLSGSLIGTLLASTIWGLLSLAAALFPYVSYLSASDPRFGFRYEWINAFLAGGITLGIVYGVLKYLDKKSPAESGPSMPFTAISLLIFYPWILALITVGVLGIIAMFVVLPLKMGLASKPVDTDIWIMRAMTIGTSIGMVFTLWTLSGGKRRSAMAHGLVRFSRRF
jgi:hypothetical protein